MEISNLVEKFLIRSKTPVRPITWREYKEGEYSINEVFEDDGFRQIKHRIASTNSGIYACWREERWSPNEKTMDITYFKDQALSFSLRMTGNYIKGFKVLIFQLDGLTEDPDESLPFILNTIDLEIIYRTQERQLEIKRIRVGIDKKQKRGYTVLDGLTSLKDGTYKYGKNVYAINLMERVEIQIWSDLRSTAIYPKTIGETSAINISDYFMNYGWLNRADSVRDYMETLINPS
ncbi:MAG: hypothetical protein FI685_03535 [SAR202 cluster bacterium]|nr:hypothetical protein [Chloroflexota bacterium]MDP7231472.1 hypothetical protein [Dehalococcoidia bacterium]MDP7612928.1 hypothetical protein [Dehalococcoidia bacterium]MQG47148.1 hypothetical protein [SAR202 cluster bacterium]